MNRNWYAVYTKPQSEKKVAALLTKKKIENLCPLNRITNGYGFRRKMASEPLFPTFVFVYITEAEMHEVRKTSDVINFVYWLGKPAIIKKPKLKMQLIFLPCITTSNWKKQPLMLWEWLELPMSLLLT
ncbi:MAG: UpxY family transcription antiterminator [Chitinophagaceae bacterium]|nr:UpxY family transcription antiterminator [Chitinophagaceae bacterium]